MHARRTQLVGDVARVGPGRLGVLLAGLGAALLSLGLAPSPSSPQLDEPAPLARRGITHLEIRGPLDVGMLSMVRRAGAGAKERGDWLVIELDTPGGQVDLMRRIAASLHDLQDDDGVPLVAWVNTDALSAGALVALTCEKIYMHPRGQIGAATPITTDPMGMPIAIPDEDVREKSYAVMRSIFRDWAEKHDRNTALAEAMVDRSVEVVEVLRDGMPTWMEKNAYHEAADQAGQGAQLVFVKTVVSESELLVLNTNEALRTGMATGIAENEKDLYSVQLSSSGQVTRVARTGSENMAVWLSSLSFYLLIAGLVLGFLEFKTPGFGIPGIAAILCFAVLLFGQYLMGLADVPHFVLVALGVVLLGVEILAFPGTLWFGLGGVICMVVGLIWASLGTGLDLSYDVDRRMALDAVWRLVFGTGLALAIMFTLSRYLPRTPVLGRLVLAPGAEPATAAAMQEASGARTALARPGALGRALTDLRPVGKVVLDGGQDLDFEARTLGDALDAGTRVRVLEVRGGRLAVEACAEGEA